MFPRYRKDCSVSYCWVRTWLLRKRVGVTNSLLLCSGQIGGCWRGAVSPPGSQEQYSSATVTRSDCSPACLDYFMLKELKRRATSLNLLNSGEFRISSLPYPAPCLPFTGQKEKGKLVIAASSDLPELTLPHHLQVKKQGKETGDVLLLSIKMLISCCTVNKWAHFEIGHRSRHYEKKRHMKALKVSKETSRAGPSWRSKHQPFSKMMTAVIWANSACRLGTRTFMKMLWNSDFKHKRETKFWVSSPQRG